VKGAALQFARFLVVGALNTLASYGVFAGLVLAGVTPMAALVVAYVLGIVFNFFTTGRYVFNDRRWTPFLRFVAAYGVIYLFNVGLFHAVAALGTSPLVTQALCVPVVAMLSFAIFRFAVFARRP
jgi:putative flippase GtrA